MLTVNDLPTAKKNVRPEIVQLEDIASTIEVSLALFL